MDGALASELVDAFIRLAKGDFTVRLARNFTRDQSDVLAFFVNLIAEELARLQTERERSHRELEAAVTRLNEAFVALASGDFSARVERSGRGDAMDVLAFMFDNMAVEVGAAVAERDRERHVLEAILESMIDGVLLLDRDGNMRRTNRALARLLGVDPASLEGKPVATILAAREHEFAKSLAASTRDAPLRDRATAFRKGDGEEISFTVSASPHRDADGELAGIVLVVRDDRELRQIQAQLQISDRLATMGTVAAGVAHEINNPLAFVIGNLEYIEEEIADVAAGVTLEPDRLEELQKAIKATRGGADRVRAIVRDLRSFSRVEQAPAARVDLQKLADSAIALIRNEARHHARIVKEYAPVPTVIADEGRLVQVFLNLIQNAAHAIPLGNVDANEIRVITGTDATGAAFFEVRDTGSGIAPEHLPRIFDLFFTTKPVGAGTGLGLAICHKIVSSLGGRIDVASEPGKGSSFRVLLPASAERASRMPPPIPHEPPTPSPRLKVLVVDDEPEVGETVRRLLGGKHDVEIVARGSDALERIARRTYDVILSDLLMPEMTGMELHERIARAQPDVARRMIFMTGGAFSTDAREFLERIANPVVEKPFEGAVLQALVANVAARRAHRT